MVPVRTCPYLLAPNNPAPVPRTLFPSTMQLAAISCHGPYHTNIQHCVHGDLHGWSDIICFVYQGLPEDQQLSDPPGEGNVAGVAEVVWMKGKYKASERGFTRGPERVDASGRSRDACLKGLLVVHFLRDEELQRRVTTREAHRRSTHIPTRHHLGLLHFLAVMPLRKAGTSSRSRDLPS